jgi:hypothetical protein
MTEHGASDSAGAGFDTVIAFDAGHDFFEAPGTLTTANFI